MADVVDDGSDEDEDIPTNKEPATETIEEFFDEESTDE